MGEIVAAFETSGEEQRGLSAFRYAAGSRSKKRVVILRVEHGTQGGNPRDGVTKRAAEAAALYDRLCCQRGEVESRVNEQQRGLVADAPAAARASPTSSACCSHHWHNLMQGLRRMGLQGTDRTRECITVRQNLCRTEVEILISVHRIRLLLASRSSGTSSASTRIFHEGRG